MSDDLYAKELLRWAADASRAGHLSDPKRTATVNNAMCGDKVTVEFAVDPTHEITDCRHETKACVLTQASASARSAFENSLISPGKDHPAEFTSRRTCRRSVTTAMRSPRTAG